MNYSEKLRDGRWQEVRLRTMERDSFTCRSCKSKSMLNVHHLYYKYGLMPWEYPSESLVTLCDFCHKRIHNELMEKAGTIAFEMLINKKQPPKYSGVNMRKLLSPKYLNISDVTNEWLIIADKINSVHGNDMEILDCTMIEIEGETEIIIFHESEYQLKMINRFFVDIVTHFRVAFYNNEIIVSLKNINEL